MKDYREIQRESARRERRALLAENVSFEKFKTTIKEYPAGSVYYWALDKVFGPIGSAERKQNAA